MNSTTTVSQESFFDPFAARRPAPAAEHGSAAPGGWTPAVGLIDPGEDPSDDPDLKSGG